METVKAEKDLEFKWKDVTFKVRGVATSEDKFEINVLYGVDKEGKLKVPRSQFYRTAIKRFVKGWEGVTTDGKPVPFSMEALGNLPIDPDGEDVMILLGSFIINTCGLFPTAAEAERKNE